MYSTNNSHSGLNRSRYAKFQQAIISKILILTCISGLMFFSGFQSYAQTTVVVDDIILRVANPDKLNINLTVYPNPATDKVIAKVDGAEQIQAVKIFDLSGRHINSYKPSFIANTYKLDISFIPAGTYVLQIKTEKGIVSRKLSVTKS